ncbi:DinB family protein [Parapedobacter indicus]|uniref:DinB superfamily protein n=1 Tax=Parapedobacter indicus TaxID=1477437 RepID=A0A1I3VHU8_9SPHI|nr:DinB family protein [Parapedobacter indicus]PPK98290.1 DinB family protein [Parapedobacter indicus]SFJ94948.1 DinB superfamily protein [Parapedobacter indicus]
MTKADNRLIKHTVHQLLELQSGKLWMGDNFNKKLDSITEEQAFIKPLPSLHSVAELVAHITAWNEDLILKIKNGVGQLDFTDEPNWPANNWLKELGWNEIRKRYEDSVSEIVNLLKEKEDTFLNERYYDQDFDGEFEYSFAVDGILHHIIYHLGQIGIVIKLVCVTV